MAIDAMSAFRAPAMNAAPGKTGGAKGADVYQQLEDYVKMTPAERMRADLLKKLGLTEEELAAKSPDERAAIDTKLRDMVEQQMKDAQAKSTSAPAPGQWVDTTA